MYHLIDFCRLCLSFDGEFHHMYNDNIIEKLSSCITDLELNEQLPALVCTKCLEQLDMYFEFRNKCLRSEFLLNKYLENLLPHSKQEKFFNAKLQVNVLKNFAASTKPLGNVKLRKNKGDTKNKKCKVRLGNIESFVNAKLLNKDGLPGPWKIQELKELKKAILANKSLLSSSYKLQDFEEFYMSISTDENHEDSQSESLTQQKNSTKKDKKEINAALNRLNIKRKDCSNKKFKEKIAVLPVPDENVNRSSNVSMDITERVKLRKRQVQIQSQKRDESKSLVKKNKKKQRPSKLKRMFKKFSFANKQATSNSRIKEIIKYSPATNLNYSKTSMKPPREEFQISTNPKLFLKDLKNDVEIINTRKNEQTETATKSEQAINMNIIRPEPFKGFSNSEVSNLALEKQETKTIQKHSSSSKSSDQLYKNNFKNLLMHHESQKPREKKLLSYQVLLTEDKIPIKIIIPKKNIEPCPEHGTSSNSMQQPDSAETFACCHINSGKQILHKTLTFLSNPTNYQNNSAINSQSNNSCSITQPQFTENTSPTSNSSDGLKTSDTKTTELSTNDSLNVESLKSSLQKAFSRV